MTHDIPTVLDDLAALAENEWLPPWARDRLHDIRTRVAALVEACGPFYSEVFHADGYPVAAFQFPTECVRALSAALLPFKGEK